MDDEAEVSPEKEKKVIEKNIWSGFRFSASQVEAITKRSICDRSRLITVHSSLVRMKLAIKKKLTFVVWNGNLYFKRCNENSEDKLRLNVKKTKTHGTHEVSSWLTPCFSPEKKVHYDKYIFPVLLACNDF